MTSEARGYERWDVAVALFPFTDIAVRKPRPIVVLSSQAFNHAHAHVLAAMITTAAGSSWDSDHLIQNLAPTGLSRPSLVRWKLFTLPFEVVPRKIGALDPVDRGLLSARMAAILLG